MDNNNTLLVPSRGVTWWLVTCMARYRQQGSAALPVSGTMRAVQAARCVATAAVCPSLGGCRAMAYCRRIPCAVPHWIVMRCGCVPCSCVPCSWWAGWINSNRPTPEKALTSF